jgi:acyl-CoA thioester hydrolase
MMIENQARIRVRYAETDQMGVVYYANYFVWMEVARVEYCRALGFEYRDMEKDAGGVLAVLEARCKYRSPAHFDESVQILCRCVESKSRTIRFSYEMRREDDKTLLASGETLHAVVNKQGRTVRLPETYRRYFPLGGLHS